jgi:hypothetical protein
MNPDHPDRTAGSGGSPEADAHSFFPRGAIFFFVVLLAFYAALWLVIYFLMIARS